MTPTLFGRWQTRFFLLATIGLIVTALFVVIDQSHLYFWVLAWVFVFGLAWDILYTVLQQFRWERDWPPIFAWVAAAAEAVVLYLVIDNFGLPGIDEGVVPVWRFVFHYSSVWITTYLFVTGPMRALFPYWRFHGGRIVPRIASAQRR